MGSLKVIQFLRCVIYFFIFIIIFLFYGVLALLFDHVKYVKKCAQMIIAITKFIIGLQIEIHLDPYYEGKMPQGMIIASEHQSTLDAILFCALMPNSVFLLKKTLINIPILGRLLKKMQMIVIDRARYNNYWLKTAIDRLNEGKNIIIFPEGTRVLVGEIVPYKIGVFKLAKTVGQKIVPVALDIGKFWPKGTVLKRPGVAKLIIGAPIDPDPELLRKTLEKMHAI